MQLNSPLLPLNSNLLDPGSLPLPIGGRIRQILPILTHNPWNHSLSLSPKTGIPKTALFPHPHTLGHKNGVSPAKRELRGRFVSLQNRLFRILSPYAGYLKIGDQKCPNKTGYRDLAKKVNMPELCPDCHFEPYLVYKER